MHHSLTSFVESFEENGDRLAVKFATHAGQYWIQVAAAELVASLRASLQSGDPVEVIFDQSSREIVDVITR